MTVRQTATALRGVYTDAINADEGNTGLFVTLFAFDHFQDVEGKVDEIARQTGIPALQSYGNEMRIGVKLAQYVQRK